MILSGEYNDYLILGLIALFTLLSFIYIRIGDRQHEKQAQTR